MDRMVKRVRALVVRFEGVGRTELEDAMFHQACAARDLDLTAIQMELMGGGKQAKAWPKFTANGGR